MRNFIRLSVTTLVLLFILPLSAQEESKIYKRFRNKIAYREAVVFLKNGEQLDGVIKRPKSIYQDADLKVVTKEGEKINLYARETLGYRTLRSEYKQFGGVFYKIELEASPVSLFSREMTNSYAAPGAGGMMMSYSSSYTAYYIMQSTDKEPVRVPSSKKKFIAFAEVFSDCQEVMDKINAKTWKEEDIRTVVKTYNNCNN